MSGPVAIETVYDGYRFRSRLEARWAVFFNRLGIPFRYEEEGFELPNRMRYLPDFHLLDMPGHYSDIWVEIKGKRPTEEEISKALALAAATKTLVFIFFGDCWLPYAGSVPQTFEGYLDWRPTTGMTTVRCNPPYKARQQRPSPGAFWWTDCPYCGRLCIKLHGQPGYCDLIKPDDIVYPLFRHATPRLVDAYTAARQARFERPGR